MKQNNKRAVIRISALFVCLIICSCLVLPLFVYGLTKTVSFNTWFNCNMFAYNFNTGQSVSITNGGKSMTLNDNDKVLVYAYNGSTYYKICYRLNNVNYLINGSSDNPTVIPYSIWSQSGFMIVAQNEIAINNTVYFVLGTSGYTLTFNSQGGSSISPLTGVSGTVHLGESGEYYPQYVPTKHGYDFVGWFTSESGGTAIYDIDVQADTTLYAHWHLSTSYKQLICIDDFYEDSACTENIAGGIYFTGETVTLYQKHTESGDYSHFYGQAELESGVTDYKRTLQGVDIGNGVYQFTFNMDDTYYLSSVIYPSYRCVVSFVDLEDGQDYHIGLITINGVSYNRLDENIDWHFDENGFWVYYDADSYRGINVTCRIYPPYVFADADCYYDLNNQYDVWFNSTVVEVDNNPYGFVLDCYASVTPLSVCTLSIIGKTITDYDINERQPIAIIDESTGEMSWVIDIEAEWNDIFSNIDYSTVQNEIPHVMNGILDGIFSLYGLSVLVTIFIVVGFSAWLIRNY